MAVFFLWIHHRRGEGATACPPHNTAYIHSITKTYFHSWRGHSSLAIRVETTWGATDKGYQQSLNWRRAWHQVLLPTVVETLGSHRTTIAHLKLGNPQPVRCCTAVVCHPRWVHGIRDYPKSRLEPWHQATTNTITKKDQF